MCGMMSFLMRDTGTVQVGLKLMLVIFVSTDGEARSGLPTTAT